MAAGVDERLKTVDYLAVLDAQSSHFDDAVQERARSSGFEVDYDEVLPAQPLGYILDEIRFRPPVRFRRMNIVGPNYEV